MSEAQTETETEAPKTRKTRGPRSEFTVGDILNLERMGALEAATAKHGDNPTFIAACRAAAGKSAAAAVLGKLGEGTSVCDFRKGVFVSLAALGAEKGSAVKSVRVGDTIVVSLA